MQNGDNLCLKYLLNELEPSEVIMMERALEEDEDLLIEVESLRATLKKLDNLDEFEPPEDLCDSIVNKAAEYQNRRSNIFTQPAYNTLGSAAAALVLIAIIFSFSNVSFLHTEKTEQENYNASTANANMANNNGSTNIIGTTTSTSANSQGKGTLLNRTVTPWVDKNEVLRFEEKFNENRSSKFDSAMHNSFKKLVPVTYSTSTSKKRQTASGNETPIHLTGSY